MSYSDLPSGYDAWRTSGPPEPDLYEVKVTVQLHFDSDDAADRAQQLMEKSDFSFEGRTSDEPGQPTLTYTLDDEASDYDYEHHLKTERIGQEVMDLTCDHEFEISGFPDHDLGL
jgi:hypothetical protein